jgi:hypothetical protein
MRPAGGTRRISVRNSKILSARLIVGVVLSLVMVAPLAAQDDDAPAAPRAGRGGGPPAPSKPTPRWPDGSVNLGAPPGQKGNWDGGGLLATNPKNYEVLLGRRVPTGQVDIKDVPLQEWARALLDYRHAQFIADEPYTRCKPSPGPRSLATAYGVELMNIPGSGRVYLFQQGGAHSFRTIYVDGRQHPKNLIPSYFGHSIGRWEGDTLVVDTVGFNERAWMSRDALPHTDQMHMIERITRTDYDTLKYEVTVDDPGAYTATWTSGFTKRWSPANELFEYVCQGNNYGPELMIGVEGGASRSSAIVP